MSKKQIHARHLTNASSLQNTVGGYFSVNDRHSIGEGLKMLSEAYNQATYAKLSEATGIPRQKLDDLANHRSTADLSNRDFSALAKAVRKSVMEP